jgi:molybdopterin converting factor small subunit
MSVCVQVLFFGATAGVVGQRSVYKRFPEDITANKAFDEILDEFPALTQHKLLYSINQRYAVGTELLHDGDELAVFTAVSGG